MISSFVKNEQLRLSHFDHASTSKRTTEMIQKVLMKMNEIAADQLGIYIQPGPGIGFEAEKEVLRFSTPFYYRKVSHPFRVTVYVDKSQLSAKDILTFEYELPDSMDAVPDIKAMVVSDIPEDGRVQWEVTGNEIGDKGRIIVSCGVYNATSEIVIAEDASGKGYGHPGVKAESVNRGNSVSLFRGYDLRNLNNEMVRAEYSPEERLILINTEAPTVRLYVSGQGHFKDGARLLLAELLLDVITDELARYYVDRTAEKGQPEAYDQAKQDLIRRYGVEVHSIMMGE
jgi:hypothetical protein